MAKTFRCTIVTPAAAILDEDVTYASFPAWDGQMGMMPGRSPLLSRLGVGSLRLDFPQGSSRWFLIDSGFAQVQAGNLTLLTERATPAEQLSAADAERELAEANAKVATAGRNIARVEHDQQLALGKKTLALQMKQRGAT
jgi:F-type H+-transporting ATPase subunit epsilon